jgi:hypothetical protein
MIDRRLNRNRRDRNHGKGQDNVSGVQPRPVTCCCGEPLSMIDRLIERPIVGEAFCLLAVFLGWETAFTTMASPGRGYALDGSRPVRSLPISNQRRLRVGRHFAQEQTSSDY